MSRKLCVKPRRTSRRRDGKLRASRARQLPRRLALLLVEEEFAAALEKTSQIQIEQLGLTIGSIRQFELSSRPSSRFHGDVVACMGDVKSQLASGGTVFLTAPAPERSNALRHLPRV